MMEVYDLFRAKVKPDTVLQRLKAAKSQGDAARKQRFNAHLYLALFHDSEGDLAAARKHIDVAVKQYQQGDYMWAVAKHQQQHLRRRAQESKTPKDVPKKVQPNSG